MNVNIQISILYFPIAYCSIFNFSISKLCFSSVQFPNFTSCFHYFKVSKLQIYNYETSNTMLHRPSENFRISDSQIWKKYVQGRSPIFIVLFEIVGGSIRGPRVQIWSHFSKFQISSKKYCNRSGILN